MPSTDHEPSGTQEGIEGAVTDAERIARAFHETYERLAPAHGYETRKASAVPWADVPDRNRALMVAVVAELLDRDVFDVDPPEDSPMAEMDRVEFYARPAVQAAIRKARQAGASLGASETTIEVAVEAALDQLYVTGFLLTPDVREAAERSGYERARKEISDDRLEEFGVKYSPSGPPANYHARRAAAEKAAANSGGTLLHRYVTEGTEVAGPSDG